MNEQAKKQMKAELKASENLQDAFDILAKFYELENVQLGFITKNILIGKLEGLAQDLKARARSQYR